MKQFAFPHTKVKLHLSWIWDQHRAPELMWSTEIQLFHNNVDLGAYNLLKKMSLTINESQINYYFQCMNLF